MSAKRIDDDWMHPKMSGATVSYTPPDPYRTEFYIMRKKAIVCSWMGDSGPPTEWKVWNTFATKKERDAALKKLREETVWILMPACRSRGVFRYEEGFEP